MWIFSKYIKIEFAIAVCFGIGIILIRPNILGESFGQFGVLYWAALGIYFRGLDKKRNQEPNHQVSQNMALSLIIVTALIYWSYFYLKLNSLIDISIPYVAFANIATLAVVLYAITQIKKCVGQPGISFSFILLVSFFSFSVFPKNFLSSCTPISLPARPYIYEVCYGSGIYVGDRLTGFSAEPGIFATLIVVAMALVIKYPLTKSPLSNIFVLVNLLLGLLKTQSTAGIFLLIVFLAFRLLALTNKSQLKISLSLGLSAAFILFLPFLISLSKALTLSKSTRNSRSITDRALELSLSDYFSKWFEFPFGNSNEITYRKGFGINLLTESLAIGPVTIFLMIMAIFGTVLLSNREVTSFEVGVLVFLSCLFSQPAWFNPIWLILVFSLISSDNLNKARLRQSATG